MTIAIIGSGKMATGIARRLARNESFILGTRDASKGKRLAASLGPQVRSTDIKTAARDANTIVLAVPYGSSVDVLNEMGELTGKVLIDISNPVTPDFMSLTLGFTSCAAEEIQKRAKGAYVVKAFNTIFAELFAMPPDTTARIQVFYATDHANAGEAAAKLIANTGFEPIFAGPLVNARHLEPLGELNIHFGYALGQGTNIAPIWVKV